MKYFYYLTSITSLFFAACSGGDIVIEDFESGTYDNWTVTGDAFGTSPASGALPGQQAVEGYTGRFLANSFNGGDDSRGTLTSRDFTIERDYINMLIGGGRTAGTYVELLVDGESLRRVSPVSDSESLEWIGIDVSRFMGRSARVRIVDEQQGGWGHILVDEIVMGNKSRSRIAAGYEITIAVENKYLLLPVEDAGHSYRMHVLSGESEVMAPVDVKLASSNIDYWVPVNVGAYKGSEITLLFDHLHIDNEGYGQIRQSDDFHFEYKEKYRPAYHFSPRQGWMNDPNGMVYHDGIYHLFFQHNPYGSTWGNMHWGHAVSRDLVKWEYRPEALEPDHNGVIFSGSAVNDTDNTAGFGRDAIVAIYTSTAGMQTQSLAYSTDKGKTFTMYDGNPVLSDMDYIDFRDPKVIRDERTGKWVMVLATGQTISFYGSTDLKQWEKTGEFGDGMGAHGGVWECPDLLKFNYNGLTKWVLLVSINPGGPNGGSATQYFVGDFDGLTFHADDLPYPLWVDYGRDNYAGVTWSGAPDGKHIFIGWMSNWDYANQVPTVNFRSAMTVPRELKLVNAGSHPVLASVPLRELGSLRCSTRETVLSHGGVIEKLLDNNEGSYEIEMTVEAPAGSVFLLELSNRQDEKLVFTFDRARGVLAVDRSGSGIKSFSDRFAHVVAEGPLPDSGTFDIRVFIDRASSEIFVNGGRLVMTNIIFPTEPYNMLRITETTGSVKPGAIKIHNLN